MTLGIKNKHLSFGFVAIVAIAGIDIWSFRSIDTFTYNAIEAFVLLGLCLVVFTKSGIFFKRGLYFKNYALLFMLVPLFSVFGAALYHNQSIEQSLYVNRYSLYWLLYFALHIFNVQREKIIKLLIFIGAVWAFITIAQQFTYPRYYFYSRNDEKKSIYRAGVYRYMIAGKQYGLFLLLYFYYKYLNKERLLYLALTAFSLLGFYYYGTRQTALAAAASMCFAVLLLKGMSKWKNLILITGMILLALGLKEMLFGEYIEMTSSQLQYNDDIRILAGRFYLFDYWPSAWAKILGNGKPHPDSNYGSEMLLINTGLRFFRSDVGIIGAYNQFGIFYILTIIFFNIKGLTFSIRNTEEKYLKLFFLNSCILLLINESYSSPSVIPFYCMVLYIIDKVKAAEKEVMAVAASTWVRKEEKYMALPA